MLAYNMKALVLLILIVIMKISENGANMNKQEKKCRRQLKTCSRTLKNECFSDGTNYRRKCDLIRPPTKSLYVDEYLAFQIAHDRWSQFRKNRTYSVFLSENEKFEDLKRVNNCCNLRDNQTCLMPATLNKNKKFVVIFPYKIHNNKLRESYCYHEVIYKDTPIDLCEPNKAPKRCITFENGEFKVKYRYETYGPHQDTPLGPFDACFFHLPEDRIPTNMTFEYDDSTNAGNQISVTFIENQSEIRVAGYEKKLPHGCKSHQNVNSSTYRDILRETAKSKIENIACFKVQSYLAGFPFKPVICQRAQVIVPMRVWIIAIPVSVATAFIGLLLVTITIRLRRMLNENTFKRKSLPGFMKQETIISSPPDTPVSLEEVWVINYIAETDDTAESSVTSISPDDISSESKAAGTPSDKCEEIPPQDDEMVSLTGHIPKAGSIEEKYIESTADIMTPSEMHSPYICKDHSLNRDAEEGCDGNGYISKSCAMNVDVWSPSTTTYIPKYYIKKGM